MKPAISLQRRGLAAARRAQQADELAVLDAQGDVRNRGRFAIALGEGLQFDCGHVSSLAHTLFKSPDARYIAGQI